MSVTPSQSQNKYWKEVLKNAIQNLIYPAMLGSFIYTAIAKCPDFISDPCGFYNFIWLGDQAKQKTIMIGAILLFFICDYLYLFVTRSYSFWHFIIHFFATFLLLRSFLSIVPPDMNAVVDLPKAGRKIAWSFLIFFIPYFLYDIALLSKFIKPDLNEEEKYYYLKLLFAGIYFIGSFIILLCFANDNNIFKITALEIFAATILYFIFLPEKYRIEKTK